jgi:hypothetical protein
MARGYWPEDPAEVREADLAAWLTVVGAPGSELRAAFDRWQTDPKHGGQYAMDDVEYQVARWKEDGYVDYLNAHPPA